jgi:hypothetical protein
MVDSSSLVVPVATVVVSDLLPASTAVKVSLALVYFVCFGQLLIMFFHL